MKQQPKLADQIFKCLLLFIMLFLAGAAILHFLVHDKLSCILDIVCLIYLRMIYQKPLYEENKNVRKS